MYENYLKDLGSALIDRASEMRSKKADTSTITDYDKGYQMALYDVISLMQQQALAFQIDLKEINLDQINPDEDLL